MRQFNHSVIMKRFMGITIASTIGLSGVGTSAHAAEHTNNVAINEIAKVDYMSMKQLQEAIQHKNDPFINQVKIFISKHFQEAEFLWGKVSNSLKTDIVDLLLGDEKDYSKKVDAGLKNHFKEVPTLLKFSSPAFFKDLIKLLDYLPE
ncbi:TPA: hypothetical protein ACIQN7_002807 [Bacillus cereus]